MIFDEPLHPIWKIILSKQCCGLVSEYSDPEMEEYQWFRQRSYSYFCPGLYLNNVQHIHQFEEMFKRKYAPRGPCLSILNHELKVELILISISLGFSILLMLLTWLFIWQDRQIYLELFKNMSQKSKKNSIISTHKPSMEEPVKTELPSTPGVESLERSNEVQTPNRFEAKRLYQGYLTALEDVQ